jgi:transmembrane sensor
MKREAAAWIEQRECGAWTADDQIRFNEWLSASLDRRVEYLRVQAAWNRSERLAILRGSQAHKLPEKAPLNGRVLPILLRFAAACVAIAAVGGAAFYVLQPNYVTYATTVGGRETLTLDDGTQIELNTDTSVRVALDAGTRKVVLDKGEAFFQVTHNAARPFTVVAGANRVVDLGTKFTVRRDNDRLEVAVMEGSARLEKSNVVDVTPATLRSGDVAIATANAIDVRKASVAVLNRETSWRRGVLVFRDATLADAATELNRYNREKLVIVDPAAAKLTFGATVPAGGTTAFIEVAQEVLGLRVTRRGNEILVSR